MTYTATYSPEDNKLRLYASSRLPPEVYARVKAAGFKWAPKQDLFVAPMWTPDREDLLIELAGEVGDEDTSLIDRAEERADRFTDYHHARKQDADAAHKAVERITSGIPIGQPILVGHHSERHARKDAERIENGMRRAVQMWRTAEYWTDRAKGAIRHAKYKERPDVRARRIKTLEAEQRKIERTIAHASKFAGAWNERRDQQDAGTWTLTKERATTIANFDGGYWRSKFEHPSGYVGPCSLWDALSKDYAPVEDVRDQALRNHAETIARCSRWLEHYQNRIAYERAMLDDAGGTVADRTGPEKGGAVRCWVARGQWLFIQKVNKVSVSLLDNWGNGGADFARTIEFDKLAGVMTRAQVDAARSEGRVAGESARGFYLLDAPPPPATRTEPDEQHERQKQQIDAMAETLRAGVQVVAAPQLFPTPEGIGRQVVGLASISARDRVLEPSAGTGALLDRISGAQQAEIVAVEINQQLAALLRQRFPLADVFCSDFLAMSDASLGTFDRIVMNPPFRNGIDIEHIRRARRLLRPGGRLVSICAAGPRQREAFAGETWIDLDPGSFSEQGTNVNAAIVVLAYSPIADIAGEMEDAERTAAPLADVPFSLAAPCSRAANAKQEGLF